MANGRSNYNRYGGYGGWGGLAAGERYLQNNPQSFSQGLQIGMQYRDPRMTQKLLMAQLELAEIEKEVTKNLEDYFTTTDVDMNSIHENDIPVLTDYLTSMKSEWFETTKLAAESDDPVAKAKAQADLTKMKNNITSMHANFKKYKNYQKLGLDNFHDFSKHNPEDYQLFLSLIDPSARREIVDGELKIIGKNGKPYSMSELEDLIPTFDATEGKDEVVTAIDGYISNKRDKGITASVADIENNILTILRKAFDRDTEDNNMDVLRSMIIGNFFGEHEVRTLSDEEIKKEYGVDSFEDLTDKQKAEVLGMEENSFLNSARSEKIQKIWKSMGKSGSWINADEQEYAQLQQEAGDLRLGNLTNEFASWVTDETVNKVNETEQNIPDVVKDASWWNARANYLKALEKMQNPEVNENVLKARGLYNRITQGIQLARQNTGIELADVTGNTETFKKYKSKIQGLLNTISDENLNVKNFKVLTSEQFTDAKFNQIPEDIFKDKDKFILSEWYSGYDAWLTSKNRKYNSSSSILVDSETNRKAFVKETLNNKADNQQLYYSVTEVTGTGDNAVSNVIIEPFQGDVLNPDQLATSIIGIYDPEMLYALPGQGGMSGVTISPELTKFIEDNPTFLETIKNNPMLIEFLKTMNMELPKQ